MEKSLIVNRDGRVDITKILLALIRSELCGMQIDEKTCRMLSHEDLRELYKVAKAHDVAHLVSDALYRCGILGNDEVSDKFKNKHFLAVYRTTSMKYALDSICSVLEANEIPYILLKGSIIRSLYPDDWMRTSCDIDILIHESDLESAVKALVNTLGYKTDGERHYHDVSLYSDTGVHLELHFSLKENMDNIDDLLSMVWSYSTRQGDSGFKFNQDPEYFVFHHIAHMSYHFIHGGCGIKPFMDLHIINAKMKYDDSTVRKYCKQCGLEHFYDNVKHVSNVWFGNAFHTINSQRIEAYILKGGVYGTLENRIAVAQSKRGGRLKYAISRIFPSYELLKISYPILEKHKYLYPFMQIRRWFRIVFFGGLGRGVKEMKINQSVDNNQSADMNDFLHDIGLG